MGAKKSLVKFLVMDLSTPTPITRIILIPLEIPAPLQAIVGMQGRRHERQKENSQCLSTYTTSKYLATFVK